MLNPRQLAILELFRSSPTLSSRDVLRLLGQKAVKTSLVTVKRDLAQLAQLSLIQAQGKGRSVTYSQTAEGRLLAPLDVHAYCQEEPDKRAAMAQYDFSLIHQASEVSLFSQDELARLQQATGAYRTKAQGISESLNKKELERFIIELSWKSSKIEGNTYTILDTERLIREGIEAAGRSREESVMILNHKRAFQFVIEQKDYFSRTLKLSLVEELHNILVADLEIDSGLRTAPVGITGTRYRPLDNLFQIREAVDALLDLINSKPLAYEKSLLVQALVPYIQPFADGNKRTSRLLANALLIAQNCAPLSYRSVDEDSYKEAILTFYETGNITGLKQIFIEQYLFSAANYNIRP